MPAGAIIGAIISGGAALVGSKMTADAANRAADIQSDAALRGQRMTMRMFNTTRRDLKPFKTQGVAALNAVGGMYGLMPGTQAYSKRAMADFRSAPDYQIARDDALSMLDNSAAARGELKSGAHMKGVMDYADRLGTQKLDTYLDRLMSMAGMGQNAAAHTSSAGLQTGRSLSDLYLAGGQAGASGVVGGANAWNTGLNSIGSNLAYLLERNKSAYSQPDSIY